MSRVAHHAIDVAAPPEACWRALADLASWPRWFPYLSEARALDGATDPWRLGGRMKLVFAVGPVRVPVTCVVEELERERPNGVVRSVRWIGKGFGVTGHHSYRVETRAAGATRLTSHEEFSGLGTRLLTDGLFARIDDEAHRSMERFKALVEAA